MRRYLTGWMQTYVTRLAGLCLALGMALTIAPAAQAQDGVFSDYGSMRAQVDSLMKARRVDELLILMGGSDEMTQQELTGLRQRVQAIFPNDFEQVDLLKRNDMGGGWRQELLVYYVGTSYMYVYMLLHDRPGAMVSVNFRFNTDFDDLNAYF